jgi:membrane-bound ClpP family serine protease
MLFFKQHQKTNRCQEWFDFKILIILKVIFLLWSLSILGIYLRMFEITRGFKIILPIAVIIFVISYFSKNKIYREKGIALFLFVFTLFLIVKAIDISHGTKYFSGLNL